MEWSMGVIFYGNVDGSVQDCSNSSALATAGKTVKFPVISNPMTLMWIQKWNPNDDYGEMYHTRSVCLIPYADQKIRDN